MWAHGCACVCANVWVYICTSVEAYGWCSQISTGKVGCYWQLELSQALDVRCVRSLSAHCRFTQSHLWGSRAVGMEKVRLSLGCRRHHTAHLGQSAAWLTPGVEGPHQSTQAVSQQSQSWLSVTFFHPSDVTLPLVHSFLTHRLFDCILLVCVAVHHDPFRAVRTQHILLFLCPLTLPSSSWFLMQKPSLPFLWSNFCFGFYFTSRSPSWAGHG